MNKKNILIACGAVFSFVFVAPQINSDCIASGAPAHAVGEVVPGSGYVLAVPLYFHPSWDGGSLYGYRAIDPNSIRVVEDNGRKIIHFDIHYLEGKKLKDRDSSHVQLDLYNRVFLAPDFLDGWLDIDHEVNQCSEDELNGCWNADVTDVVQFFVSYIKENRQDVYNDVMEYGRIAQENLDRSENERLLGKLDEAYQNAQEELPFFSQLGENISWDALSSEAVDYSKVPPLSDLIGHVFQLSDSYGFRTERINDKPVFRTGKRRNALVHFSLMKHPAGYWMVCLMDDTGDFVEKEYINSKPIAIHFRSYHEDYGYYKGMSDQLHKTGSFSTLGGVVGAANLVNGVTDEGLVHVGIEKTNEVGKYHLVYYMTQITWDEYKNQHVFTNKYDGYYATLTLLK